MIKSELPQKAKGFEHSPKEADLHIFYSLASYTIIHIFYELFHLEIGWQVDRLTPEVARTLQRRSLQSLVPDKNSKLFCGNKNICRDLFYKHKNYFFFSAILVK